MVNSPVPFLKYPIVTTNSLIHDSTSIKTVTQLRATTAVLSELHSLSRHVCQL